MTPALGSPPVRSPPIVCARGEASCAVGMTGGNVLLVLWESLLFGALGAAAGAVVGAMTADVLNFANIHLPLSVELLLMSDSLKLSGLPSTLGGAIALISIVTFGARLRSAFNQRPSRCFAIF